MSCLIMLLNIIILVLPILINVAFITLMERKILGLSQLRLGPNKNSVLGLLQPFSDALKLFIKQTEKVVGGNTGVYLVSPSFAFLVALMLWGVMPTNPVNILSGFSVILFLMILSLGVYPILLAGWSSLSKYAMIGSVRGVAQTISYEISLALIMVNLLFLSHSVELTVISESSSNSLVIIMLPLMFLMWIISMIAETNRTPFDFAEGESELVSGFNIEYASVGFALIFMAEYASILVLSGLSVSIFVPVALFSLMGAVMVTMIAFFWMWVRATYPRYRYDLLMQLAWKSLLPLTLGLVGSVSMVLV